MQGRETGFRIWRLTRHGGVFLGVAACFLAACTQSPPPQPLPQHIYIWNRDWNESVHEGVRSASGEVTAAVVLAAQVQFEAGKPISFDVPVRWDWLKEAGMAVGAAIRIGVYSGPFDPDSPATQTVLAACHQAVESASSAGIQLSELHIDFDSPESKLAGYRQWIDLIEREFDPILVTLTTLPSWLRSKAFKDLVAESDGYVLQVHSFERPAHPDDSLTLCDPDQVRSWVRAASQLEIPFRVALPTYGYLVAFDPQEKFVGLWAEGPTADWPPDHTVREIRTDPAALAGLVRSFQKRPPDHCTGLFWFRLPVTTDRLNWRWPTLAAVIAGRDPRPELTPIVDKPEPQLVDLSVINKSGGDVKFPVALIVEWEDNAVLAGDALAGVELEEQDAQSVRFVLNAAPSNPPLQPGNRRSLGWLRFQKPAEVRVHVEALE